MPCADNLPARLAALELLVEHLILDRAKKRQAEGGSSGDVGPRGARRR